MQRCDSKTVIHSTSTHTCVRQISGWIVSRHDPIREPLIVVELPLPVVVVALSNQVQAERHGLTLVQMWHQAFAARACLGRGGVNGVVVHSHNNKKSVTRIKGRSKTAPNVKRLSAKILAKTARGTVRDLGHPATSVVHGIHTQPGARRQSVLDIRNQKRKCLAHNSTGYKPKSPGTNKNVS